MPRETCPTCGAAGGAVSTVVREAHAVLDELGVPSKEPLRDWTQPGEVWVATPMPLTMRLRRVRPVLAGRAVLDVLLALDVAEHESVLTAARCAELRTALGFAKER